jgi:hypothetical protein
MNSMVEMEELQLKQTEETKQNVFEKSNSNSGKPKIHSLEHSTKKVSQKRS